MVGRCTWKYEHRREGQVDNTGARTTLIVRFPPAIHRWRTDDGTQSGVANSTWDKSWWHKPMWSITSDHVSNGSRGLHWRTYCVNGLISGK